MNDDNDERQNKQLLKWWTKWQLQQMNYIITPQNYNPKTCMDGASVISWIELTIKNPIPVTRSCHSLFLFKSARWSLRPLHADSKQTEISHNNRIHKPLSDTASSDEHRAVMIGRVMRCNIDMPFGMLVWEQWLYY